MKQFVIRVDTIMVAVLVLTIWALVAAASEFARLWKLPEPTAYNQDRWKKKLLRRLAEAVLCGIIEALIQS